jgi:hypothetical protein
MTAKPKLRARRKKVAPVFYTPVDGWEPDHPMMEECDYPTWESEFAYSDGWFYWAINRDKMI